MTHFLFRASDSHTSVSPHSVLVPSRRSESPVGGRLDLDHLGAELTQDGGAVRACDEGPEIEDADFLERAHERSPMRVARSSSLLATLICMRSIISPFLSLTAPRPSRAAASMASSTSFAQAIWSADGVITS